MLANIMLCILTTLIVFALSIFLTKVISDGDSVYSYERDKFVLIGSIILTSMICFMCWYKLFDDMIRPIDVYRGKTDLVITGKYVDGKFIHKDTTVVWKDTY